MPSSAPTAYLNPCTAGEAERFALILRRLLDALDGEIVTAALIRESKTDLLDPERQEVNRVREFLDGRISMRPESFDLRSRALAVLDSFADEVEPTTQIDHSSSPSFVGLDNQSVGEPVASGAERRAHASDVVTPDAATVGLLRLDSLKGNDSALKLGDTAEQSGNRAADQGDVAATLRRLCHVINQGLGDGQVIGDVALESDELHESSPSLDARLGADHTASVGDQTPK